MRSAGTCAHLVLEPLREQGETHQIEEASLSEVELLTADCRVLCRFQPIEVLSKSHRYLAEIGLVIPS